MNAPEIRAKLKEWKQRREKARATGQAGMEQKADDEITRLKRQLRKLNNI